MSLFDRLLVVGAHGDDPEFLAGGTIARFAGNTRVVVIAHSDHVGGAYTSEYDEAMGVLGVNSHFFGNMQSCTDGADSLQFNRQAMWSMLVREMRTFKPTVVISHQSGDTHQDHSDVRAEVVRVFKSTCPILLGCEPWNDVDEPRRPFFVTLDRSHVEKKLEALRAYKSQFEVRGDKCYFNMDWILAQMKYFGGKIGVEYAEAFEVVRLWV